MAAGRALICPFLDAPTRGPDVSNTELLYDIIELTEAASKKVADMLRQQVAKLEARTVAPERHPTPSSPESTIATPGTDAGSPETFWNGPLGDARLAGPTARPTPTDRMPLAGRRTADGRE
jgi:hypothetical protein